jgi:hypothetical protein
MNPLKSEVRICGIRAKMFGRGQKGNNYMLRTFFTIVYFAVLAFLIQLMFRDTLSIFTDILAVVCLIIALIASVGLADYTVKKIEDNYRRK